MLPLDEMLPVQQGGLQKGALRRRPVASNQAAAVLHQTAHRCEEGTSEGNIADNVAEGAHARRTPTGFNCTIAHVASHCTPSQRAAIIALPVDLTWPIDLTFKELTPYDGMPALILGDDADDDMPALELDTDDDMPALELDTDDDTDDDMPALENYVVSIDSALEKNGG